MDVRSSQQWKDVRVGDLVPRVELLMTTTRIARSALGSMDAFEGHHVTAFAQAQGQEDIYANTATFQGFIDRVVSEWSGPDAFIRLLRFSIKQSVFPGDTLYGEGTVTRVYRNDVGESLIDIEFAVGTERGLCVPAFVTMALPDEETGFVPGQRSA